MKRIAIIDADDVYLEMINPKIVASDGEQLGPEGCLSVEGRQGNVLRPMNVKLSAQDRNGRRFTKELSGFAARACCHEVDHLDGILFIDKLTVTEEKK